jgi:hypothetical protein
MSNRTHFIIRSLLQNSKLNRENFVNNKKKYNLYKSKTKQTGFNRIITRNLNTNYTNYQTFGKGPGNNGPNYSFVFIMFASALSVYISKELNKNKK